ncbi:MAG: hypothetical protein J6U54_20195 [Clostridiales bacterium]|nr:hypothetical protein [Clostridiales bacterium]
MSKFMKELAKIESWLSKDRAKKYTAVNAIGVVVTAGVSFKAGRNVQKKIDDGTFEKADILKNGFAIALVVAITEFAGYKSYAINVEQIAKLTVATTAAYKERDAFKKKLEEVSGKEEVKKVEEKIAEEHVESNPNPAWPDISGSCWWMDHYTKACFYTSEANLVKAWTKMSNRLVCGSSVSIGDYFDEIEYIDCFGIPSRELTDKFGWNGNYDTFNSRATIKTNYGADVMPNGTPCRVFEFMPNPESLAEMARRCGDSR